MKLAAQPDILVFGRSGQLARALSMTGKALGLKVACAGRDVADLSTSGSARTLIDDVKPRCVINAAAYTAVDAAESEPAQCRAINTYAPAEMAQACKAWGIRFVHISTDYVFNGESETPYLEDDQPDPINTYGRSKLDGEINALDAYDNTAIVRTSAVFSGWGDDFPSKILKLAQEREALSVVSDQMTGPTPVLDLAARLIQLSRSQASGIFHCSGQPYTSWADFAAALVNAQLPHRQVTINPVSSEAFPTPAQRPRWSCLGGQRLSKAIQLEAPDWRHAITSGYPVGDEGKHSR